MPDKTQSQPANNQFVGYHSFLDDDQSEYGSFEVFHADAGFPFYNAETNWLENREPGYYWAAGQPGCLFDSEPSGPFDTSEAAYLDARGG